MVVAAAAGEAVAKGLGRVVGTLPVLHSAKGDPAEGWETFPSGPASARCSKPAGSWARVQWGEGEEEEETILHSSEKHAQMWAAEGRRQEGRLGWGARASTQPWRIQGSVWMAEAGEAEEVGR